MNLVVESTAADAARAAALLVARSIRRVDRSYTVGLAGGSTPKAAYFVLRQLDVPWHRVVCWLPDERHVPRDDAASNGRMAREELTDHVPAALLEVDTSLGPADAATAYWDRLREAFTDGTPDVVMLGMGSDGHTASLFPGTAALDDDEPGYLANWVEPLEAWRLTATMPLLWTAEHLVFLVTGPGKADMVRRVLVEEEPLPAARVAAGAAAVTWILDEPAASKLS